MIGIIFTGFPRERMMAMPTLGAYRLRTFLAQHGHQVEVVDFIDHWTDDEVMDLLSDRMQDGMLFIGFSVTFIQLERLPLMRRIRSEWPHLRILIGAQEPRLEHYVRRGRFAGLIDMLFLGFSEMALLRYVQWLRGERPAFEDSGEYMGQRYVIGDRVHPYLDTEDLSVVWKPGDAASWIKALPLEISRGCVFKCRFCNHSLVGKKKLDYIRDCGNIADELRRNHELFGISTYLLADDTFNDTEHKLDLLARAIDMSGVRIRFSAYLRYDLLHRNPHHITKLRDMGLHHANLGIESMDERARKAIGKGLTNSEIIDVLSMLKDNGMTTNSAFIVGLPHETEDDLRRANEWVISQDRKYLDSWTWGPLWIGNHLHMRSEFERESVQNGYYVDPIDELRWWGPTMDSEDADRLCNQFNSDADWIRGPVGFEVTELASMGIDIGLARDHSALEINEMVGRENLVEGIASSYKAAKQLR